MTVLSGACAGGSPSVCDAEGTLDDAEVIAAGPGPVAEIRAASSAPGDLAASDRLYVRVRFRDGVPDHHVFLDPDGDRASGMWTLQSPVSAAGWDRLVDPGGTLLRHAGGPMQWRWEPIGGNGFGRSIGPDHVDLCIPTAALADGRPARVRIGVLAGDDAWLPEAFLPGAAYPAVETPDPSQPTEAPAPLAFHYGASPWEVRDCGAVDCAADVYGRFAHVVLGAGLEEPDHPGHEETRRLVRALRNRHPAVEVWGYVSLVGGPEGPDGHRTRRHTAGDVAERATAWAEMGTTGVFLDEAGVCRPEWGQACPRGPDGDPIVVDRRTQADAVDAVHGLGLAVFGNAHAPLDLLGPLEGAPAPLDGRSPGRPADVYLLENPTVASGELHDGLDAAVRDAKYTQARRAREDLGIRIAAVDTGAGPVPDSGDALYRTAYERAAAAGVDAYAYTNPAYSAPVEYTRNLPLLEPPEVAPDPGQPTATPVG